ncbi:MAG: hypothetical protein NZL83_03025 [Candidatus Absconditabacterales bacterium]|nr:hypothetical protein [Candidatus Absconditabacterales bacterium]
MSLLDRAKNTSDKSYNHNVIHSPHHLAEKSKHSQSSLREIGLEKTTEKRKRRHERKKEDKKLLFGGGFGYNGGDFYFH